MGVVGIAKEGEDDAIATRDGRAQIEGLINFVCIVELIENMDADLLDLVEEEVIEMTLGEPTHSVPESRSGGAW